MSWCRPRRVATRPAIHRFGVVALMSVVAVLAGLWTVADRPERAVASAPASYPAWVQLDVQPSTWWGPWGYGPAVYYPKLGAVVYFDETSGGTWMFDQSALTWRELASSGPGQRVASTMVYDRVHDTLLLYGGAGLYLTPVLTDTWSFDGTVWTQLHPATTPPSVVSWELSWNDPLNAAIMFVGGQDPSAASNPGQTWMWDGVDWTQLHPMTTPAPIYYSLSEDRSHHDTVLFGGFGTAGLQLHAETWLFDGVDWVQAAPATSPPQTADLVMFDDPELGVIVAGGTIFHGSTGEWTTSTWVWDGTSWSQLATSTVPPTPIMGTGVHDDAAGIDLYFDSWLDWTNVWALVLAAPVTPPPPSPPPPSPLPDLIAVNPERILETRVSEGQVGYHGAKPQAGQTTELRVVGVGAANAASDATAVMLNVTVTNPEAAGYVRVWPCGQPQPQTSNINFVAGETVANLAIAAVGSSGTVCLSSTAATDLVVDLDGWVPAGSSYQPSTGQRVLDTRVDGRIGYFGATPSGGQTTAVRVAGTGDPAVADNASAVVVNVTITEPEAAGFVTVWPCGQPRPPTSNVDFAAGETVANLAIAAIGSEGSICLFSSATTHLVVDVAGWMSAGSTYRPVSAQRLLDTRRAASIGYYGFKPSPGRTIYVDIRSVDRAPATASSLAVLNITVTNATSSGFITVWPCDTPRPATSNVNFVAGQTVANLAVSRTSAFGQVCLYTSGYADLIADIDGILPGPAST